MTQTTLARTWRVEHIPVLRATITLPRAEQDTAKARRFNRFYRAQQEAYLSYCQGVLLPLATQGFAQEGDGFTPRIATMTSAITRQDDQVVSLWTESRDETTHLRHGDTWDMASGYPLPITAVFPGESHLRRRLAQLALGEIQEQERSGEAQFHPGLKLSTLQRRLNLRNFYLLPDGVAFFYQRHTIAPGVEGIPTFVCPYLER